MPQDEHIPQLFMQACDVLYEAGAVGPIAELAPRLLFTSGGRLLLADPAERTVQNRRAFPSLNPDFFLFGDPRLVPVCCRHSPADHNRPLLRCCGKLPPAFRLSTMQGCNGRALLCL